MLVACLAGCGGAGTGGRLAPGAGDGHEAREALSVVKAAARSTLAAPAGVEFELRGARAFGSSSAPVIGSGEFDFPRATGSEKIDLGEVRHQEPGNESVIFLPSRVYLQPKAPSTRVLPKGKEWVSATLAGSDGVKTNFPSFALQVEGVNPQFMLTEISDGAVSALSAGPASIAGVPTRAYDVDVDLARALSASEGPAAPVFGEAIQSELAALAGSAAKGGPGTSIRVWVDGAGHVLRLESAPPGAGVGVASMTMCCFGLPVAVSAPPSRRVVDIAVLTPSGERENNGGGDSDGG